MNKTHRLIWSDVRQTWVVTHEAAAAKGKSASQPKRLAVMIAGALLSTLAVAGEPAPTALPTGGQVVSGSATISQSGNQMTINQATNKAIVNWNTFNIGSNAGVTFNQPSSSSVALNRVLSSDPSAIYGSLRANGQVFLINPNGVIFGQGASVNVQGLVASTLNISDADFMNGNYRFTRDGAIGSVLNQGEIIAKYVALLAPEVRNEGVIAANMGTVALAAGDAVTLNLTGQNLVDVQVTKASINTLISNQHLIQADEGTVILSAQSANGLIGSVVNSGQVEANGITSDGGVIRIRASSNIANTGSIRADAAANGNGGNITAIADLSNSDSLTTVDGLWSAKGGSESGNGGFIETSAAHLKIASTASINTSAAHGSKGQWLLDPYDFTVAASGGDITGADLSTALGLNNVTIETTNSAANCTGATCSTGTSSGNGDILINDAVSWSASNTLTLSAWRNVEFNANMTLNGSNSGLTLQYGQGGTGGYKVANTANVTAPGGSMLITDTSGGPMFGIGNLASGTTSSGYVSGGGSSTLFGYIYLANSTTTSVYGDTPTFNWSIYDSATSGGNLLSLTTTGTASWSDVLGNVGTYSLWYAGGLSASGYTLMGATNPVTWTVTAKPLDVSVSKTYDGSASFNSGFNLSGSLVGSDSMPTVSSGSASVSSANAGSYNSFASNSLTLSNSNYAATGGVSATINAASGATPPTQTTPEIIAEKVTTTQTQQNLVTSVVNQGGAQQGQSLSGGSTQVVSGTAENPVTVGGGGGSTTQTQVQALCSQCNINERPQTQGDDTQPSSADKGNTDAVSHQIPGGVFDDGGATARMNEDLKKLQLEINDLMRIPTPDPDAPATPPARGEEEQAAKAVTPPKPQDTTIAPPNVETSNTDGTPLQSLEKSLKIDKGSWGGLINADQTPQPQGTTIPEELLQGITKPEEF